MTGTERRFVHPCTECDKDCNLRAKEYSPVNQDNDDTNLENEKKN